MANNTGQKFGGRKKGTPNRTTNELRERFEMIINENLEQLKDDLKKLIFISNITHIHKKTGIRISLTKYFLSEFLNI